MEYEIAVCGKCGERRPYVSDYHTDAWEREHKKICTGVIREKVISTRNEEKRSINPVFIGKLLTVLDDNNESAVQENWSRSATDTRPPLTRLGFKYFKQSGRASNRTEEIDKDTVVASLLSHGSTLAGLSTVNLNHSNSLGYLGRSNEAWRSIAAILSSLKGNSFALACRYDDKTYMTAMSYAREADFGERLNFVSAPAMVASQEMELPFEAVGLFSAFYNYNTSEIKEKLLKSSFELLEPSLEEGESVPRLTNGIITLTVPPAKKGGQTLVERFALMEITGQDRDVILARDKKSSSWKSVRARAKGLLL